MKKAYRIFWNAVPILIMIGLIPAIRNDFGLALVDVLIIAIALSAKRKPGELPILILGFFIMIIFEFFFVSTGVETFTRNSLFSVMPLWLPIVWAYGFVAIKRGADIISS